MMSQHSGKRIHRVKGPARVWSIEVPRYGFDYWTEEASNKFRVVRLFIGSRRLLKLKFLNWQGLVWTCGEGEGLDVGEGEEAMFCSSHRMNSNIYYD